MSGADTTFDLPSLAATADALQQLVQRLLAEKQQTLAGSAYGPIPAINTPWPEQGGIYAGIAAAEDDQPDGHIVLLDEVEPVDLPWLKAIKHAKSLGNGARLPTRFESALLYANVRSRLDTSVWHWTGTQYSDAGYAWCQYFTTAARSPTSSRAKVESEPSADYQSILQSFRRRPGCRARGADMASSTHDKPVQRAPFSDTWIDEALAEKQGHPEAPINGLHTANG